MLSQPVFDFSANPPTEEMILNWRKDAEGFLKKVSTGMVVGLLVLFGIGLAMWSMYPSCFDKYTALVGFVSFAVLGNSIYNWLRGHDFLLFPVIASLVASLMFLVFIATKNMLGLQCDWYAILFIAIPSAFVSLHFSMKIFHITGVMREIIKQTTHITTDEYQSEIIELDRRSNNSPVIRAYMDKVFSMGRLPVLGEVIASRSWRELSEAREIQERWSHNHTSIASPSCTSTPQTQL